MVYGYIRVSTREQNEERQLIALRQAGVAEKNIYMDKQSGKDFERPQYKDMVRHMRRNDLLYIKSIDRLGRNYEDVLEQWRFLTKIKSVDIVVLDMPLLDTRRGKDLMGTFLSDIVLQVLSFVAENERTNIRQRQAEGIAAARARGVRFGRVPRSLPPNFPEVHTRWRRKQLTLQEAADACGLPRSTFYDRACQYERHLEADIREAIERAPPNTPPPLFPETELKLTILPYPCFFITSQTACVIRKRPNIFTLKIFFISSRFISATVVF